MDKMKEEVQNELCREGIDKELREWRNNVPQAKSRDIKLD
jgi:hypothetical protein